VLDKYQVELIGATPEAIDKAEDRLKFKDAMTKIGLGSARLGHCPQHGRGLGRAEGRGLPHRHPAQAFTWAAPGAASPTTPKSSRPSASAAWRLSPTNELLIEESLLGWKEYEMEVVRDKADNCIIICSIENLDPMGVHTGDSITVAPAQTLTDKEYQIMRNASLAVLREIGVETGGSNVQFSHQCPKDRPHGGDRDEPPCVPVLCTCIQGHGLSRLPRSPPSWRWATPSMSCSNDITGGAHPGLVRAGHRLRRYQDSALRLREVPESRCPPDHPDEIRG
jgi:hypothetical protein